MVLIILFKLYNLYYSKFVDKKLNNRNFSNFGMVVLNFNKTRTVDLNLTFLLSYII